VPSGPWGTRPMKTAAYELAVEELGGWPGPMAPLAEGQVRHCLGRSWRVHQGEAGKETATPSRLSPTRPTFLGYVPRVWLVLLVTCTDILGKRQLVTSSTSGSGNISLDYR